jgi:hypothetical protein
MNKTITSNSCKTIINKLNKIIRSEIRATIRLLNGNQDARTALCAYFNEVSVIGALLVAEGTRSRYFLNKG